MSYDELIRVQRAGMSKSFAKLADFILDSHVQAALMTATEIAHQVDVDAATVVRFAQRLGYGGFPELQAEIKSRVLNELLLKPPVSGQVDSTLAAADSTLEQLRQAIEQTRLMLDGSSLDELVEALGAARRVLLVAEGIGQAAAYNLMNVLEQGGFIITLLPAAANDLARGISTAIAEDLLLVIDITGEAPYIARALEEAREAGLKTAAIAGAASHASARVAQLTLTTQSQTTVGVALVVMDALVYALAEAVRWRYRERFAGSDKAMEAMFERLQIG